MTHPHDVLVVGGGVAGLSAALTLSRARRSVLVIDAGEPRNAPAAHSHNYLTRDGTPPRELQRLGRQEVETYGGQVVVATVVAVRRTDTGFEADLDDGTSRSARRLLVATGLVDVLPAVEGIAERWGRDVVHCPVCFGWEVRDLPLGVLAPAPMAAHAALMWRQWTDDLTLFLPDGPGPGPSPEELARLQARGITVVSGTVSSLEITDDRLSGVRLASGEVVPRSALVVVPRMEARHGLLDALGVQGSEHPSGMGEHVQADPTGFTGTPGVWVAGNTGDLAGGVAQSAASGVTVGWAVNADLTTEDTDRAVSELSGSGR